MRRVRLLIEARVFMGVCSLCSLFAERPLGVGTRLLVLGSVYDALVPASLPHRSYIAHCPFSRRGARRNKNPYSMTTGGREPSEAISLLRSRSLRSARNDTH